MYIDKDDKTVFLWQVDFESDIALFRTRNTQETPHGKAYHVRDDQLAVYEHQPSINAGEPVWSAAYCGTDHKLKSKQGQIFLDDQKESKETKEEIPSETHTVFEYMMNRYLHDLDNTSNTRPLFEKLVQDGRTKVRLMNWDTIMPFNR